MTPEAMVLARHPAAYVNWSQKHVEVRDGAIVLGQTRMMFRAPFKDLEAKAWADAARKMSGEKEAAR
jgi:hypothetical protein